MITMAEPELVISIVSHGHGALVAGLLGDLRKLTVPFRCVLTLNVPEDEGFLEGSEDVVHKVVRNTIPRGFGTNHNAAFGIHPACRRFLVLNPDARLPSLDFKPLFQTLSAPEVGLVAPLVFTSAGMAEDSFRKFPTVRGLVRRCLMGHAADIQHLQPTDGAQRVDWVGGMFMLFRADAYKAVQGFDERYFMYLEDVDICKRLALQGWATYVVPAVAIVHDARRASRTNWKHFAWHLRSALRYFTGI